jgi:tRNA (guanine37-N1)-methyltransferase
MGNTESPVTESFGSTGLLEEPQFTRPSDFRGWEVPEVLRSGDHAKIAQWRLGQAIWRTVRMRPDLIEARGGLTDTEKALLEAVDPVSYPSEFTVLPPKDTP